MSPFMIPPSSPFQVLSSIFGASIHHGHIKPRRDHFSRCYTDTWLSVTQTIFHDLFALGDGQLSWIGKLGLEDTIVDEFTSDWIYIACSP